MWVQPAPLEGVKMNRETYIKMSDEFKGACHSVSMATSGRYLLTQKDNKKGYYIMLEEEGIPLKLPFRALFETNDKISPINSLSFCSAFDCPSDRLGLCQLCENKGLCYAKAGQRRANGTFRGKKSKLYGARQINSTQASKIVERAINALYKDKGLYKLFLKYIDENIKILRFNLKGDFRSRKDIKLIKNIAEYCQDTILYGYSARDDILKPNEFDKYYHQIYLNGSNMKYTNYFKVTTDLKEYFQANNICLGGCKGCGNCFTLIDSVITVLLHGKDSDKALNTPANREFLATLLNALNIHFKFTPSDFNIKGGLFESLKTQIESQGVSIDFENFTELKLWLDSSHYEIKNSETVDLKTLEALGVA